MNEMNEKLSFKMGVIFTYLTYMGENWLCIVKHSSKSAGNELQSVLR